MTASRRLLYGETSRMHCSGVILAHSSTQTVFKSWRFRGPLLWTLIFSSFHRFSIGFKSGDWLGHSSSFIFFLWNQLRVSLAVCLGSLSCWNVHPRFIFSILVDATDSYQECLGTFLHSSFLQLYEVCQDHMLKKCPTPWCSHLQTSLLASVFAMMCSAFLLWCVLWHSKSSIFLIWLDYILPVFHRLVQMLCSKL